ncbi:MAG TPA: SulP family inorganic anion transporter [Acidimicrobiales bacterium]|nr:SulP family inorganic anion transporter [Acidimicrobiales bacterium]
MHGYQRAWLGADLGAGVMLLAIAVPEQLATARLAGMPPITGFFAFVAGTVLFALLGSNALMSVGADSTIAPLFAVGIAHLAPTGSAHYIGLVGLVAVEVGVLVVLVGVLRLGWIAEFLSAPIISGFLAGVAVIIVVHQLPDLFGLPSVSGTTLHRVTDVVRHIGSANRWTLGIGVVVFAMVLAAERVDRRLPGALFGLVGSTIVVAAAGLRTHGVAVLGTVAHAAPHVGLTDLTWSSLGHVLPVAAVVALVVVSQSAATTSAFAAPGGYEVDVGRDFIGVGAGSILSGLVGSFAVNASPARTAAVASTGGRTQAAGLGAAAVMVAFIPAAGLLTDVPLATLAAVLIYVATRIFHARDLLRVLRFDTLEFVLALLTLVVVAVVGVEQGIAVAVGLAILDRTRRSARPKTFVLGRIPGTTSWEPTERPNKAAVVPGVVVFFFGAPLYFANAGFFRMAVHSALATASPPPRLLVLDAVAIGDIDFTGAVALSGLLDELAGSHVDVAVARAMAGAPENLARSGLLDRIGRDHLFPSVDEAVLALGPGTPAPGTLEPGTLEPADPGPPETPPGH